MSYQPRSTNPYIMVQDINDIKGSLNSISDNLSKKTISNDTKVDLTPNTEYTTLTDGYMRITIDGSGNYWATGQINDLAVIELTSLSTNTTMQISSVFVRKGTKIKYTTDNSTHSTGRFYPLA